MSKVRFSDLRAVVLELAKSPQHQHLPKKLEQAVRAQSCHADLRQAEACLQAIDKLLPSPRAKGTVERNATEAALLMSCVVLYARATHGGSGMGERGSVSVRDQLSSDLKIDHDALVNLRNQALAHVYLDESVSDGPMWHEVKPFLQNDGDGLAWHVGVASRSTQFDRSTIERLRRLLPEGMKFVRNRFRERLDAVTSEINDHSIALELIEKHEITATELFGSIEAGQIAVEGRSAGEAWFFSLAT